MTAGVREFGGGEAATHASTTTNRWLVLGAGVLAANFAVGAPFDISIAAWIAPVFLLRFSRTSHPVLAIAAMWLVSFMGAWNWSFQVGDSIQPSTFIFTAAFGTVFSIPYVLDRVLVGRLSQLGQLLLFPAAVVVVEFAMGVYSPLGTAYGIRAITQTDNPGLLQVISVAGPYSVGFLIGWFATTVNLAWEAGAVRAVLRPVAIFAAVFATVYLGGAARVAFAPNPASYVNIAGITPSRQIQDAATASLGNPKSGAELAKLDPARVSAAFDMVIDDLIAGTHEAAQAGAKLVVWSETAASATPATQQALLDRASRVARQENVYVNVALGEPFARNETHLIGPDGRQLWQYSKNYPVPLLEPVRPVKNTPPTIETPFGRLTNVICFDADFPALTRVDADIMVVPGVDWPNIGRTHTLKMASLRAIENGYSLVRIAYHSQSAAFDRYGRILATQNTTSPDRHIMYADVPTKGGRTLYNMTGDILAWLSIAGVLAAIVMAFRRRPKGQA